MDRKTIRKELRLKRLALSLRERRIAALSLARLFCSSSWFTSFRRFGVYIAADAEIDPAFLVKKLWADGKICYLPVLSGKEKNRFLEFKFYQSTTVLVPNRFGIPEPQGEKGVSPIELDIVLTPLVAFDLQGYRLGMGGGYYDRTFASLRGQNVTTPYLIGLAYEFQKISNFRVEAWDVPLAGVFTEKRFYTVCE